MPIRREFSLSIFADGDINFLLRMILNKVKSSS